MNSAVVSAAPLIDLVELGMPFVAAGTFETINVDLFEFRRLWTVLQRGTVRLRFSNSTDNEDFVVQTAQVTQLLEQQFGGEIYEYFSVAFICQYSYNGLTPINVRFNKGEKKIDMIVGNNILT